jgi:hypothetical protein
MAAVIGAGWADAGKVSVIGGLYDFDFLNIQSKCNKTKGEKKNGQPKGKPVNWKLARSTRKE